MSGDGVLLTGLDGSNPLGFLAALGVLTVLDDAHLGPGGGATLRWEDRGRWTPRVAGVLDADALLDVILANRETWRDDPSLALAYTRDGARAAPDHPKAIHDLKPPPNVMRGFFDELGRRAADGNRRAADVAAAYATDVALDNSGNIKPTALHFTAGQQTFLKMVVQLRDGVAREDLVEGLFGPWTNGSKLPSLSWDATTARLYALRASDPSAEKRGSNAGAEWLAFLGMRMFKVAPDKRRARTTCVRGRWKSAVFTWPVWTVPAAVGAVRALLAQPHPELLSPAERQARGIGAVFQSGILRSSQGGYGSFTPARVC